MSHVGSGCPTFISPRRSEYLSSLQLNINNLFDKAYYQGIGGSYGHYGSPRFAGVTLRYDF